MAKHGRASNPATLDITNCQPVALKGAGHEYLYSLREAIPPTEQTVRGYKVRTVQQVVDPREGGARRQEITEDVPQSLRRSKGIWRKASLVWLIAYWRRIALLPMMS